MKFTVRKLAPSHSQASSHQCKIPFSPSNILYVFGLSLLLGIKLETQLPVLLDQRWINKV